MDTTFLNDTLLRWEHLADELERISNTCMSAAHAEWNSGAAIAFREELAARSERILNASRCGRDVVDAYRDLITAAEALPEDHLKDLITVDPITII